MQKDVLKEIGNIGSGNAVTALAQLLNEQIAMNVPIVNIASFDDVMQLLGGSEHPIAAVLTSIKGDITGKVYVILPIKEAEFIVDRLTGEDNTKLLNDKPPQAMVISALQEAGNILTGSYLSALSDFTGLGIHASVPEPVIDMAGAVLAAGLIDLSQWRDDAILINTEVKGTHSTHQIQGYLLLLPDPDSFTNVFSLLGVQDD